MKIFSTMVCVAALVVGATTSVYAAGNKGGTNPGGQTQGFASKDIEITNTYMGMSDKTPPNDRAGASKGTRTETTSYTVEGPKGQVDKYDGVTNLECNNCSLSEPTTEMTDAPGANR